MLASAPLFPKFVSNRAAMYHELRKRGTSAGSPWRHRCDNDTALPPGHQPATLAPRRAVMATASSDRQIDHPVRGPTRPELRDRRERGAVPERDPEKMIVRVRFGHPAAVAFGAVAVEHLQAGRSGARAL